MADGKINDRLTNLFTNMVQDQAANDKLKEMERDEGRTKEDVKGNNAEADDRNPDKRGGKDSDSDEDFDADDAEIIRRLRDQRIREAEEYQRINARKDEKILFPGEYREIVEEEFLPYVTKNEYTVCHFYHNDFERCRIFDKHLRDIAATHPECKFMSLNVEKAPFFVTKLQIKVLPTLCAFKDGVLIDKVVGFADLGEKDDFKTIVLTRRLVRAGVIKAKNDDEKGFKVSKKGRGNTNDSDSDQCGVWTHIQYQSQPDVQSLGPLTPL
eukprot:TRINITY_DN9973_c0_g2_i1.p2 TRINITY_DN9973_c0_g2~~TRINITY_DN9973_c0_g2_i1.p2  ORF type:complete len:269 (+),score=89.61 TRINITY_DN9973_c0_g2_i1:114-920(+)